MAHRITFHLTSKEVIQIQEAIEKADREHNALIKHQAVHEIVTTPGVIFDILDFVNRMERVETEE